jgi:hypothetical protein
MQNVSTENVTDEFLRKIDSGLSERRLLEELGKLSCDEMAAVLVTWYRDQTKAAHVAD